MYRRRVPTPRSGGPAPSPAIEPGSLDEIPRALRDLRLAAGSPSFTEITARVRSVRERRGERSRALVARSTVYDCFADGRRRLDIDLVADIGRSLLANDDERRDWADRCWSLQHAYDDAHLVTTTQLPEMTTPFVGRIDEIEQLTTAGAGVTAISAMAGCGKTSLAAEAARRLIERGAADRAVLTDLRGFHPDRPPADAGAALDSVIRALGGQPFRLPADLAARRDTAYRMLAEQRVVLVLDDAESAEHVAPLVEKAARSIVYVTSRVSLDALPAAHLRLGVFTPRESITMLRAALDAPGGPGGADDASQLDDEIAALGAVVGHHPLALAAIAGRISARPGWSLADHRAGLEREGDVRLDRSTSAALERSYEALPDDLRRVVRLLAVQPCRDLSTTSLAALAGADGDTADELAANLLATNLAIAPAPDRIGLHALVRAFGREQTLDDDRPAERIAAIGRLADHLVATARAALDTLGLAFIARTEATTTVDPHLDAASAPRWLNAETDNLLAADQSWEIARPTAVTDLSEALFSFLHRSGRPAEAAVLHRRALHAAQRHGDVVGEGLAESCIGQALFDLGDAEEAAARLQRADRLLEPTDDASARYRVKSALAANTSLSGDPATALQLYQQCRDIAIEAGLARQIRSVRIDLAGVLRALGRHDEAVGELENLVADLRGAGDVMGAGGSLLNLAIAEENRGNYEVARARAAEAAAIAEELGLGAMLAHARHTIGLALTGLGDPARALVEHEAAMELGRELGNRHVEAMAMTGLGSALARSGRPDAARAVYDDILAMKLEVDPLTADVLVSLARLDLDAGDTASARTRLAEVVRIVEPPDSNAIAATTLLAELDRRD